MSFRMSLFAICIVMADLGRFTAAQAEPSGWGLVVNRTTRTITLDVTGASGQDSTWTLQPSRALKLRNEGNYTVRVRESGDAATIEAVPKELKLFDFNDREFRYSPDRPEWVATAKVNGIDIKTDSPWALRWYQVVDVDQRPQIRSGFGAREVNDILRKYREQMELYGFGITKPFVYSPFNAMAGRYDLSGPESIEAALGNEARRQQHRIIADVICRMIVADADDVATFGSEGHHPDDLLLFSGRDEISSVTIGKGDVFSEYSIGISMGPVSPEVFGLVKKVVAAIGGVDETKVAFIIPVVFAAAPSGYFPLRQDVVDKADDIVSKLQSIMFAAVNEDMFVKTLTFDGFDPPSETIDFERAKVSTFTSRSAWMYHGISHIVVCKDKIPALRRTDMRFRVTVTGSVRRNNDIKPTFQVQIRCDVETRPGGGSLASYRQWNGELPLVVKPIGGNVEVDMSKATYELQQRIQMRCEAGPPT